MENLFSGQDCNTMFVVLVSSCKKLLSSIGCTTCSYRVWCCSSMICSRPATMIRRWRWRWHWQWDDSASACSPDWLDDSSPVSTTGKSTKGVYTSRQKRIKLNWNAPATLQFSFVHCVLSVYRRINNGIQSHLAVGKLDTRLCNWGLGPLRPLTTSVLS